MDSSLYKATEEFVSLRINHHRMYEKESVSEAYEAFREVALRLRETLNSEQEKLFEACEDAYAFIDGESCYYHYKAGFGDALRFLLGWGGDLSEVMKRETQ